MRTLANLLLAALFGAGLLLANHGESSRMVLKMDRDQVEAAQRALASLKGVQKVSYDEQKSELTIFYDKPSLGCCSRIHSALQQAGVKYTLVSNVESPACKGKERSDEHSDAAIPPKSVKHKKQSCCKKGSSSTCARGV